MRIAVGLFALGILFAKVDDRAATETLLREIEASPRKEVASELVGRSRGALDRAAKLRASGDAKHAEVAEGAALGWAEAARDVVKAADVEARAAQLRRDAADAGAAAERERALVEEGVAQTGRLKAQLEQVNKETTAPRTSKAANANANAKDGGAK